MKAAARPAAGRRFYGSIGFTVLVFNCLLVFLPVAAVFFLDTYEKQRLRDLEQHLSEQASLVAVALRPAGTDRTADDLVALTRHVLQGLGRKHQARIRVFALDGGVLADSAILDTAQPVPKTGPAAPAQDRSAMAARQAPSPPAAAQPAATPPLPVLPGPSTRPGDPRDSLLYRIGSWPVRALRQLLGAPRPAGGQDYYDDSLSFSQAPEIRAALEGGYGASTRIVGGREGRQVVLYSAVPVQGAGGAGAVVVVSQSTSRLLADLYEIRLEVFRIFLWSVGMALLISLGLGIILGRPLARLSRQAAELLDGRGRMRGRFQPVRGHNEIGLLSASLADMSAKLARYTDFLESFSQDLAHEIRNPLAAVSINLELLEGRGPDEDSLRLIAAARADLARINTLVGTVRELGQIDTEADLDGLLGPDSLVEEVCRQAAARWPDRRLACRCRSAGLQLSGVDGGRFRQVVENLVENALSFAPPGTAVEVDSLSDPQRPGWYQLAVRDRGPGFPPADAERLFERFYSSRKQDGRHTGLGLAIVRSLVERWAGEVRAENAAPGARFVVCIPGAGPESRR